VAASALDGDLGSARPSRERAREEERELGGE
jgi:hypothetical protein